MNWNDAFILKWEKWTFCVGGKEVVDGIIWLCLNKSGAEKMESSAQVEVRSMGSLSWKMEKKGEGMAASVGGG